MLVLYKTGLIAQASLFGISYICSDKLPTTFNRCNRKEEFLACGSIDLSQCWQNFLPCSLLVSSLCHNRSQLAQISDWSDLKAKTNKHNHWKNVFTLICVKTPQVLWLVHVSWQPWSLLVFIILTAKNKVYQTWASWAHTIKLKAHMIHDWKSFFSS